jgi:hypothetical protein
MIVIISAKQLLKLKGRMIDGIGGKSVKQKKNKRWKMKWRVSLIKKCPRKYLASPAYQVCLSPSLARMDPVPVPLNQPFLAWELYHRLL